MACFVPLAKQIDVSLTKTNIIVLLQTHCAHLGVNSSFLKSCNITDNLILFTFLYLILYENIRYGFNKMHYTTKSVLSGPLCFCNTHFKCSLPSHPHDFMLSLNWYLKKLCLYFLNTLPERPKIEENTTKVKSEQVRSEKAGNVIIHLQNTTVILGGRQQKNRI